MTSIGSITTTPATGDISSMDGTLRPEPGAPAKVHINHKGDVETNFGKPWNTIDADGFGAKFKEAIKQAVELYEDLSKLKEAALAEGKPNLANEIQKYMDEVMDGLNHAKGRFENLPNLEAKGFNMRDEIGPIGTRLDSLVGIIEKKFDRSGLEARVERPVSTEAPSSVEGKGAVSEMEGGKAEGASGGGASGVKGADGSDLSAEQARLVQMPPAELHNAFAADPEGTWKTIASLPPQDRNMVMQALQMAIQQDNQLQSMLSNFMKSMHDTAKATISNLRV